MMNNRKKSLSLIEAFITIAILGITLGTLANTFSQGFVAMRKGQLKTTVYDLLQEKLEEDTVFHDDWPPATEARANVTGFSGYERRVVVTSPCTISGTSYSNLACINVTVWWDNGNYSQSIETAIADYHD